MAKEKLNVSNKSLVVHKGPGEMLAPLGYEAINTDATSGGKNFVSSQLVHEKSPKDNSKIGKKIVSAMYGAVTIRVEEPNNSQLKRNIRTGQIALSRAKDAFINKGVKLKTKQGVAIYQADPSDSRILIRNIDGKKEKGIFVNSSFKAVA